MSPLPPELVPPELVPPHGGQLVQQCLSTAAAAHARAALASAPTLVLNQAQLADVEMLATGAMSPLKGFMGRADRLEVVRSMRLADGTLWPIPITLQVPEATAAQLHPGDTVGLLDAQERLVGSLAVQEIYSRDVLQEAQAVFGTDALQHPGVAALVQGGPWCLAGPVHTFEPNILGTWDIVALTPKQTRAYFIAHNWHRIVAFQTRNPIHRAHEYIIKCAMETADGLLLHPLVGATKSDDIPVFVRLACYRNWVETVLPKARTCLSVLPAAMRYAGPKEAVLHAIMRQNYGCSHFIVGRDHAGVGNYYGTYDAQQIFATLPQELHIMPLFYENAFFCRRCAQMGTQKTCPHDASDRISLSGTKVREMLHRGVSPPPEFTRPQTAEILLQWARQ